MDQPYIALETSHAAFCFARKQPEFFYYRVEKKLISCRCSFESVAQSTFGWMIKNNPPLKRDVVKLHNLVDHDIQNITDDTHFSFTAFADALQLLASFLLSPDRATLQLLHVLDWRPVLQQLAPVTANLHSNISDATAQQVSLLDNDMSSSTTDAGLAPSQQSGVRSSHGGFDAGAKAWAAQLLLLVMQAYVIMADDDLPDWISRLVRGRSDQDLRAGVQPFTLSCTCSCLQTHWRMQLNSCNVS